MLCQLHLKVEGGDTAEEQPVELIHGVSQLPDGYGKIFNAAAMLPQCCLNAVENAVYTRNKMQEIRNKIILL